MCSFVLSFVCSFVRLLPSLHLAFMLTVHYIMKAYMEGKNMQLELIRFH